MTTSHWRRNHSSMTPDMTVDVLIVGGGYLGLGTAYWLTEIRPDLKITIIEKTYCGAGASGRNAGFLTLGSASFYKGLIQRWGKKQAQSILEFAQGSLELTFQHLLHSSPDVNFERTSSLTLFQTSDQHESWQNDSFRPEDFHFTWKSGTELPSPLCGKFHGAYEIGPEYKINPVQFLNSLKKRLTSRNVQILENVMAAELTPDGVMTEVNVIKAKQTVLALNGYFPQFHPTFKELITPRRAQMLAVEIQDDFQCPSLYYDPLERVYWRKVSDKTLVIGGKRLLDEVGETGDFEKLSPQIQRGLEHYLSHQLGLRYKVVSRWSGIMGFTEHELPYVSRVDGPTETFMVGGLSGHGMGLGFKTSQDLAELVLGMRKESFFSQFKKVDLVL